MLPSVSMATVAMTHGVNVNLLRPLGQDCRDAGLRGCEQANHADAGGARWGLRVDAIASAATAADIRIELRRGATSISVTWPCGAATECAAWMRELLR